ncbi:BA75_00876T0 [Komagataella pastoris]|uniref:RNA helicase n=1 Tax=Komagataella pastoris TaxID=4922 RepID=A0A1B2J639_PICPA|nr:BA75_00876T0 [Komagataella pastoris]
MLRTRAQSLLNNGLLRDVTLSQVRLRSNATFIRRGKKIQPHNVSNSKTNTKASKSQTSHTNLRDNINPTLHLLGNEPSRDEGPSHMKFSTRQTRPVSLMDEEVTYDAEIHSRISNVIQRDLSNIVNSIKAMKYFNFENVLLKEFVKNDMEGFIAKNEAIIDHIANVVQETIEKRFLSLAEHSTERFHEEYLTLHFPTLHEAHLSLWRNFLGNRPLSPILEHVIYLELKPHILLDTFNSPYNTQNIQKQNMTFNTIDITNPVEWFPEARKMKRKFIMHVGPTNSGKTYNALLKLEQSKTGYYAGPLRLLAREVYEKFQRKGVRCNLLTGEEVIPDYDDFGNQAGLTSGTVEMVPTTERFDVVVLDEIQMISDPDRGQSWTNVVIGVLAKEIHLCGEESSVPLIKRIIQETGDEIEVNKYNRLGQLIVDDKPIDITDLRRGDCIVSFSKNMILNTKSHIEDVTDFKCGVIYGALPPEVRSREAQKFNDGEYDLIVASDAIGMGLNLNINRVVFTTSQKYDGRSNMILSDSQFKQIGGRAGRFGVKSSSDNSKPPIGHVSAFDADILDNIRSGINAKIEYLQHAMLWPTDELWIKYYSMFPRGTTLVQMLERFEEDLKKLESSSNGLFQVSPTEFKKEAGNFFCNQLDKTLQSQFLITDQIKMLNVPISLGTEQSMNAHQNYLTGVKVDAIRDYLETVINRDVKSILDTKVIAMLFNKVTRPSRPPETKNKRNAGRGKPQYEELRSLETIHKLITVYTWLSYRYSKNFIDREGVTEMKDIVENTIVKELDNIRAFQLENDRFSISKKSKRK